MQEQQRSNGGDFNDLLIMAACAFWVDLSRQSHARVAAVRYEPPNVAENVSLTGGGLNFRCEMWLQRGATMSNV